MTSHISESVRDTLEHLAWRLRHPSVRRCPACRLTWEPRDMIRAQGGVCHDCVNWED